jgi:type III restriction enzyme
MLTSQWQERLNNIAKAKGGQTFVPPVLIVVCDNTDMAQVFFEKISGETVEEISEEDDDGNVTTRKERRYNPDGVPFPDLANTPPARSRSGSTASCSPRPRSAPPAARN